jgi:hypothetical protein
MLNKEQMFILNEFINKHATKNVWNISDKLIDMASDLIHAKEQPKIQVVPVESTCLNAS